MRKMVSLLLVLVLLCAMIPANVFAAEPVCTCVENCMEGTPNEYCDVCGIDAAGCTGDDVAALYVAEGTCGAGLTWNLDEGGVLTISGTGSMYNYDEDAPWYDYRDKITALVVESGVTDIGNYAFWRCANLAEVSIADSVGRFGSRAFSGCNSLKEITIPENQGMIFSFTFSGCNALTSITIPDSITAIHDSAFAGSGLTSVTIPDSVTQIGNAAFKTCTELREVHIGRNVRTLGETAFGFCDALESVWFTGDAPNAGANNVFARSSGKVYYPVNNETWTESQRKAICGYAAWVSYDPCEAGHSYGADGLCTVCGASRPFIGGQCGDSVYWEYDGQGMLTVSGTGAMYDYSREDSPWKIYNNDIVTVVVQEGVTTIGYGSFMNYKNLREVTLPETLIRIASHGFSFCPSLEQIQLPQSLQEIGGYAFSNSGLRSVHLGPSVRKIGSLNPFYENGAMQQITVADENPYYCAVDNVLFTKDMTKLLCYPCGLTQECYIVPDGVTAIGASSFDANKYIMEVVLPESVVLLDEYSFFNCRALSRMELPSGLQKIENMVFGFTALDHLVIPASVESIGHLALSNLDEMKAIIFEGDLPQLHSGVFGSGSSGTETTAFYPVDNDTWTSDALHNYGGTITWKSYRAGDHFHFVTEETDPTCTEDGHTTYTCIVCGDSYVADEVKAPGHSYKPVITESTCTKDGFTTYTCTVCGDSYVDDEIKAPGHNYKSVMTAATCTKEGYTTYTCTVCGDSYVDDEIKAPGHNYESVVTEPTYTEGGFTTHTCTVCGDSYVDSHTEKLMQPGDMTLDGVVNDQDVAYLLWHTLFPNSFKIMGNADFSGDGTVDDADVAYLLWHTLFPDAYPLN